MAMMYFRDEAVDWVVLETGLGGKRDATNVVNPEIAVITSIGLDHTDSLGDTIELIASEKCGIIKTSTPVIVGPSVPIDVVHQFADPLSAEVT